MFKTLSLFSRTLRRHVHTVPHLGKSSTTRFVFSSDRDPQPPPPKRNKAPLTHEEGDRLLQRLDESLKESEDIEK
jgi:hypothetical protein